MYYLFKRTFAQIELFSYSIVYKFRTIYKSSEILSNKKYTNYTRISSNITVVISVIILKYSVIFV